MVQGEVLVKVLSAVESGANRIETPCFSTSGTRTGRAITVYTTSLYR